MKKYFILFFGMMSILSACSLATVAQSEYISGRGQSSSTPGSSEPSEPPEPSVEIFTYGRSLLNGHQLAAYDEILKNSQNWKENAADYNDIFHRIYYKFASQGINISSSIEFGKIASYVRNDHPRYYSIQFSSAPRDPSFKNGYLDTFYTYGPLAHISLAQYNSDGILLEDQVKKFLAGIYPGMSDAQKARYLHDRLLEHVAYSMGGSRVSDAYGALVEGRALCEGYARGYLYLLQRAGVNAFYTEGYIQTSTVNNTWGLHAWVGVQLEGVWYYVDITSDDGVGNMGYHHDYFLMGQSEFDKGFKYNNGSGDKASFPLPAISPTNYPDDKSLY